MKLRNKKSQSMQIRAARPLPREGDLIAQRDRGSGLRIRVLPRDFTGPASRCRVDVATVSVNFVVSQPRWPVFKSSTPWPAHSCR